jgi:two-component system chemotaxis response regulator CheB
VDDGHVWLDAGPRENGHRPSVDVLFRSAATARDGSVVGVVLSGTRDDGSAGLAAIKARGGVAVVQDPDDALYAGMPASAIAHVAVDAVAESGQVAGSIAALVRGEALPSGVRATSPVAEGPASGSPLTLVCPECGGVLSEHEQQGVSGWRCHVGHTYGPRSLVDAQGRAVESVLWTALRSLEDRAALLRRLADQAVGQQRPRSANLFRTQADAAQEQAELLRAVVRDAAAADRRLADGDADEPFEAGEVA